MTAHLVTPLVRVPWNEPGIVGKCHDGGAWGIICQMVNNKAEAQCSGTACLYPPTGNRSNGPIRAAKYGEASNYQKIAIIFRNHDGKAAKGSAIVGGGSVP